MHLYLISIVFVAILTMQMPVGECGPARSIALVAQRSPKIPISIRAPFKHTETMVARGYGKRAYPSGSNSKSIANDVPLSGSGEKDKEGFRQYLLPRGWGKRLSLMRPFGSEYQSYGKKEMDFLDDSSNSNSNNDGGNVSTDQVSNEVNQIDGVPLEWVTKELATNPGLLKAVLYRFVDTNKDGLLSSQEFLGSSNNEINNNSY